MLLFGRPIKFLNCYTSHDCCNIFSFYFIFLTKWEAMLKACTLQKIEILRGCLNFLLAGNLMASTRWPSASKWWCDISWALRCQALHGCSFLIVSIVHRILVWSPKGFYILGQFLFNSVLMQIFEIMDFSTSTPHSPKIWCACQRFVLPWMEFLKLLTFSSHCFYLW